MFSQQYLGCTVGDRSNQSRHHHVSVLNKLVLMTVSTISVCVFVPVYFKMGDLPQPHLQLSHLSAVSYLCRTQQTSLHLYHLRQPSPPDTLEGKDMDIRSGMSFFHVSNNCNISMIVWGKKWVGYLRTPTALVSWHAVHVKVVKPLCNFLEHLEQDM